MPIESEHEPLSDPPSPGRVRTVLAAVIGNLFEWYDFIIYGFFAPVIASQFFDQEASSGNLLKVFAVFAVGYFARPIGRAGGGGAGGDRAPTPRTRREGAGPRAASNRRRRAGGVERAPRLRGARERLDAEPHASQRRGRRDAIAVAGSVAAVRGRGRSRRALARSRGARRRGRPHLGGVQERDDGQSQGDHRGGSRAGARGELAEACRFRRASPR